MFMKKYKPGYKSGCADKNPNELPGVRKKSFILPFDEWTSIIGTTSSAKSI